jgi:hypothetical protein
MRIMLFVSHEMRRDHLPIIAGASEVIALREERQTPNRLRRALEAR